MNGAVGGSHDAGVSESAKSVEETLSLSCWLSADLKRMGTSKGAAGPTSIHVSHQTATGMPSFDLIRFGYLLILEFALRILNANAF